MGITMEDTYTHTHIYTHTGLPRWQSGKESTFEGRRHRFHLWVGKSPWRRKWQPTPVLLPRKSHGQRSLASYSQWGHKELDTIEQLSIHTHPHTHVCVYIYFFEPHFGGATNTGVGCHSLLQEIFLTQGLNLGLPHCRQMLYRLSHQGSLYTHS